MQTAKTKLVVLTTEWLPWLQTNWRDSGYERFALVLKTNLHKPTPKTAQFTLQPQYTNDVPTVPYSK